MELKIRDAKLDDLKQINEIALQIQKMHIKLRPDLFSSKDFIISEEYFNEVLTKGVIFVGETDDKINSYAICFIETKNDKKIIDIDAMAVHEKHKNQGIGTKMMNHIVDYAKKINCNILELGVMSGNDEAAGFYKNYSMNEKYKRFELDLEGINNEKI